MIDEELVARLHAGRTGWPALPLDDATFVKHLRERSPDGKLPPFEHAADLFLACACATGVDGAPAAFDSAFRGIIRSAVARVDRSRVDDATQIVLVSLLVADRDAAPRISGYSGRSSLRSWLATVATRATLKLLRRMDDRGHESLAGLALAFAAEEPELVLAKVRHGPELAASLQSAFTKLGARDLVLLRLHHVEGLSIDRLGTLYRVGRSTAARWVAAAREHLLEAAKRDLRARLNLTPSELESLVALLQSNLEMSLVRLLGDDAGAGDVPSEASRSRP